MIGPADTSGGESAGAAKLHTSVATVATTRRRQRATRAIRTMQIEPAASRVDECAAVIMEGREVARRPAQDRRAGAVDRVAAPQVVRDQRKDPRIVEQEILLVFTGGAIRRPSAGNKFCWDAGNRASPREDKRRHEKRDHAQEHHDQERLNKTQEPGRSRIRGGSSRAYVRGDTRRLACARSPDFQPAPAGSGQVSVFKQQKREQ